MKRIGYGLLLTLFVIMLVMQVIAVQAYPVSAWSRLYEGIQYANGLTYSPRVMRAHAIRVSLYNPDVVVYASPGNGGLPDEATRQLAENFANSTGCLAAVNASFFTLAKNPYTDIWGLQVSNGSVVSSPDYGAPFNSYISFTSSKVPTIAAGNSIPAGCYNAVAGAETILAGGTNLGWNSDPQPATSIGISADGRYLIMAVVDGRQSGYSEGATPWDMAQWMLDFGASTALKMDGGGSTRMALNTGGGAGVINSPSEARTVPSHLGVTSQNINTVGASTARMNISRFDMVKRANGNRIVLRSWTAANGWFPVTELGGETKSTPAIVSRADGKLDIFARNASNNKLYKRSFDNGTWTGWTDLGGDLRSGPSVCSLNANHWYLVYRTASNTIGYLQWNNGTYSYGDLAGGTYDDPAICARGTDTMCLFERCTDGQLYQKNCVNGVWGSWVCLGGTLTSAPAVTSRHANNLEIFYRGPDYCLWYLRWENGVWSYGSFGGPQIAGRPTVISLDQNSLKVHVRDTNDHLLENCWTSGGGWTGYTNLGAYYD